MTIRYHTLWVRGLCCLAVAIAIANVVYFNHLVALDLFIRDILVYSPAHRFEYVPRRTEFVMVLIACLIPAVPRIHRPTSMLIFGGLLLVSYVFIVLAAQGIMELILPVASPVLSVLSSTTLMQTMAWSEERSMRKALESLATAHQRFTDMLVHDLKKHMSSILMSLAALPTTTSSGHDPAVTIRASGERILMLINSLLDVRKMQEGHLILRREPLQLNALIKQGLDEHAEAAELIGARLRLVESDSGEVRVDRGIFSRILTNLLWNALKHAPAGSEIEVACGRHDDLPFFHVANHGAPIPPEEQARIFHPFVSGSAESDRGDSDTTGLGLAFCKLAVEAHGGTIALQSPWLPHADGVKASITLPRS